MSKRTTFGLAAALIGSASLLSGAAQAKAPALPTCSGGLAAAISDIVPKTLPGSIMSGTLTTSIIPAAPEVAANPPTMPTPVGPTPAYCQVTLTYSSGASGPNATVKPSATNAGVPYPAYNVGETQQVKMIILLPLSAADGGSGGEEGNWNGGVMVGGSHGNSSTLTWTAYTEGLDDGSLTYGIRLGYVSSITDVGETAAAAANAGATNFAIVPSGTLANQIVYGPIADWAYRGTHYGKEWADAISKVYYGKAAKLHYYNGCSGGGNQGMGQLQNYGDEYDGMLIGAPAYYWQQGFWMGDNWQELVFRKLVQLDGLSALPTTGQLSALSTAVTAACDVEGTDTVADGIIADPRECVLNFTATANICGLPTAPAAPNCLTADQAAAVDRIWDGPRNSHGKRIWYGYDIDVAITASINLNSNAVQVVQWDHANASWPANNCLFVDQESLALGTTNTGLPACASPGSPITFEDEITLGANTLDTYTDNQNHELNLARNHGTKIIQLHGGADTVIVMRQDYDYYNRVATWNSGGTKEADYKDLQSWYRFYLMPGVGHCYGAAFNGVGPSAYDPFISLRNWVEKGTKPKFIAALAAGNALEPGRTRPLCPFPQTAVYNGSGSTDDINSFTCEGNLQKSMAVKCNDVRTPFKQENTANLDYAGVGLTAKECAAYLPPPHSGTPTSP